jgi:hypothetical protein
MAKNIRMEWRQGSTGLGNVYVFNPKPSITRANPQQYQVEYFLPLSDGVTIQNLGMNKRVITLRGILVAKNYNIESVETLRDNLINGIGQTVGQLHIISITNTAHPIHKYYIGQLSTDIAFEEQTNPAYQNYTLTIVCGDPYEYLVQPKTITSSARIS